MDQNLINLLIGVVGTIFGWVLKVVWDSLRSLQEDMKEIEKELHTEYVSKVDYRADILEVKDILKQIFNKLDSKADKP
jgi:antirestriction protein